MFAILVEDHPRNIYLVYEEMSFKGSSVFSSGGHLVRQCLVGWLVVLALTAL